MPKLFTSRAKKRGLPPGTPIHLGEGGQEKSRITIFDYDEKTFIEKTVATVEESFPFRDKKTITWINIDGIKDLDCISKIDAHFGIHPLVLEDIVNTGQRPKMEDYGEYLFIVLKMFEMDEKAHDIAAEQISIILGPNFVISFQETKGDIFDPIRDRIRHYKGRVHQKGADYLAYVLIDSIVDYYFMILEKLAEKIESLEEKLFLDPTQGMYQEIHQLKSYMIFLRKQIWPLREVISGLQRLETRLIAKDTGIFLRDVYDHCIQVMDTIESFRDTLSGMHDIYLSSISFKMNEVMKVLTVIATIFIPLTFIVGVYGMNFRHMPELEWWWAYPSLLSFMVLVAGGMILYFKNKKWI